ncbi:MAG: ribonuclease [Ruminococcaceae bacterium]|nr:ribonuclease [Oscillospiraceae bacterium]
MLSSCEEGIELGDIIEEIEYLVGFDTIGGDTQPTDSNEFDEILNDFDFEDDIEQGEQPSDNNDNVKQEDVTEEPSENETVENEQIEEPQPAIDEYGTFTSKDDVALYIHTYGKLPQNFITKNEARDLGWEGGGLEDYAPGKCIGGDYFGNFEGLLPEKDGREYTECDIDTLGKSSRGPKRIVFSNDGLIYYTDDHYESFTLLYGKEE